MQHTTPRPAPRRHLSPPQILTLSFAAMILAGALLLNLPAASRDGQSIGFINALFTATSANCVTGLVVATTATQWTLFGQLVILALIQLGGLGLVTITVLVMVMLHRRISLRNRMYIQASFGQETPGGMVKLVRKVVLITAAAEGVGAVLLAIGFYAGGGMTPQKALWNGVFHAISGFCNAGFDILGEDSLVPYAANPLVNITIMLLIIMGGLGFMVIAEWGRLFRNPRHRSLRFRLHHLTLHSKLVLVMTAGMILLGAGLFAALEWHNPLTMGSMPPGQSIMASFFQSVTLRTAGFFTISQGGLTDISKFLSSIWMLVGGSAGGTAGGLKVITLGVILVAMVSVLRGRAKLEAFGRTLPLDILQKALTVMMAMLLVVFLSSLVLHFSEQDSPFAHGYLDLFYECSSAAGTVGLTTGITPHLSTVGKLVITLCMFLGRLSPVTVVMSLNMRLHTAAAGISFPEERVIIG